MRRPRPSTLLAALCLLAAAAAWPLPGLPARAAALEPADTSPVRVWEESITIPTYLAGEPEPNPMFYFGRASQGAEGRVYPYPLYDTLTHKKVDKTYRVVWLENEYVRIGVLPEIGGRIFEGVDKTNGYHFFYRQHVIKPALIGLIGAWISGGVEWNIPHHHRATTFIPVQHTTEENPDGSRTIWVGELELRHRMRWAVGYTLHPGKSYLECKVRIVNRTPVVNTMLAFANVAVHANEQYQVIFPPRTQLGTHHHKREFVEWPIARSRYGGADFSAGVDVSWYKNHVAANSIFAWNYEDDFVAGYDHGRKAGTMAVADHHIVPGKKLWTWGNGPRGRMWDRILTDDDGPYIEIMVGAYSDNQPDYSWLQPYETKSFSMWWYPFRETGGVKNATLDAAVNLDVRERRADVAFYTTSAHTSAEVTLRAGTRALLNETIAIDPARPFARQVALPAGVDEQELVASISSDGRELVSYSPVRLERRAAPAPVTPPAPPEQIKTNEELYLTGLRIEQFHNPTLDPDPYWEEALRRDPGDARVNTALGITSFRNARFADAERFFRKALERLTERYTTPKDGEALYYLGLTLKAQGRTDEAFDVLYRSTWSMAWRAAGYYSIAEIAALRGDFPAALRFADQSLHANALNLRALTLKAAALRHLDRRQEAGDVLTRASQLVDPLDARITAERWLLSKGDADLRTLTETTRQHPATAQEVAAEYMNAGLWRDGSEVLRAAAMAAAPDVVRVDPVVCYYLAYFDERSGAQGLAAQHRMLARKASPDYVFPFQYESIDVLRAAMRAEPKDARAPYYLGNLLFDWQPDEAVRMWELSASLDDSNAIVHRNLAAAYARSRRGDSASLAKAIASLEKAVAGERTFALHFHELDSLYEAAGTAVETRLERLEKHQDTVARRDDALARLIDLKIVAGKYDEAIALLSGRRFAVWEGGSLAVADAWTDAHLLRGRQHAAAKRFTRAIADYQAAANIPDNLPSERRDAAGREAEIAYWLGVAHDAARNGLQAKAAWERAAAADTTRGRRFGGTRGPGASEIQRYYQARAMERLGKAADAKAVYQSLVDAAVESLRQAPKIDFFASFGDQQSQRSRIADAHYVAALGHLGLGQPDAAKQELARALQTSPGHLAARTTASTTK
jgi:tetratricopeptide (TPR) repeat protein